MKKYVYFFGNGTADGNSSMKNQLGGKGARAQGAREDQDRASRKRGDPF